MLKVNSELEVKSHIENNRFAMLYFSSNTCGVCTIVKEKLETELKKFPNIKSIEIPALNNQELLASYNIFTLPAILLYIDGKEYIREARFISLDNLIPSIARLYNLA